MRISDWSSDVCSSDLGRDREDQGGETRRHLFDAERRQQCRLLQADGGGGDEIRRSAGHVLLDRRAGSPGDGAGAGRGQLCRLELLPDGRQSGEQEVHRNLYGEVRRRRGRHRSNAPRLYRRLYLEGGGREGPELRTSQGTPCGGDATSAPPPPR